MARIKKQGLDYFPIDINFIHQCEVRRVMKREGDIAGFVLLMLFSSIYGGKGYYVRVDDNFVENLADNFFQLEGKHVRRIIEAALELGLFDADLYQREGVLTSRDIQRQYLCCTRRRQQCDLDKYCLLTDKEYEAERGSARPGSSQADSLPPQAAAPEPAQTPASSFVAAAKPEACGTAEVYESTVEVYPGTVEPALGTQSKVKQSKEKQSKENPLLKCSPESGGTAAAGWRPAGGEEEYRAEARKEDSALPVQPPTDQPPTDPSACHPSKREWTHADVDRLQPPADGLPRNLEGLLLNLRLYHVPPKEQYAIVLKSNFGVIGHPMWRGFEALRTSHGKIREPGKYLLSLCKRRD